MEMEQLQCSNASDPNDEDGITSTVGPDQTAPFKSFESSFRALEKREYLMIFFLIFH